MCISSQVPSTVSGQGEKLSVRLTERVMSETLASYFPASFPLVAMATVRGALFRWDCVQG